MKIVYWNIQGGKKIQVLGELLFIKKKEKLDIMIIVKIMTNEENIKILI